MFGRKSNPQDTASATGLAGIPPAPAELNDGDELESLWKPAQSRVRKSVEQILLERNQITEEQLEQAKKVKEQTPGKSLVQILQTMNAATEGHILSALAETLCIDFESPQKPEIDAVAFGLLSPDYIRKNLVLPIRFEDQTLV